MKLSPLTRARKAGAREIDALVQHSPCIRSALWVSPFSLRLDVDLPFLTRSHGGEIRQVQGFRLAVSLPPRYPLASPEVAFLGHELIFHPAVSPRLATFCMGPALWYPDLGLARFVVLHLEAVIGLVAIDTLDGLFLDPACADAAVYYRRLRESGGLPLVRPTFSTEVSERASCKEAVPAGPDDGSTPSASSQDMLDGKTVTVRGPAGRRRVTVAEGKLTCPLAGTSWFGSQTVGSFLTVCWLSQRIERETGARIEILDGAPVLSVASPGQGQDTAPAVQVAREIFEPLLRRVELPLLALGDARISEEVSRALMESGYGSTEMEEMETEMETRQINILPTRRFRS